MSTPNNMKQCFGLYFVVSLFFSLIFGKVVAQDPICFNLHNSLVDSYLTKADQTYTNTIGREGYSVLDYKHDPTNNYILQVEHVDAFRKSTWAEQPASILLQNLKGTKVLISASPSFDKSFEFAIDSEGSAIIYNLAPQAIYWYKSVNDNNVTICSGAFKTTGHLRMIRVENALNVRDMGGWACFDSNGNRTGHIAYGKLYRGGTLDGVHNEAFVPANDQLPISTVDAQMLANLCGVKVEVDLRGDTQSSSRIPGATLSYFNYYYIYSDFLQNGFTELQKSLTTIANNLKNNKPTYFHCEWGADRTGSLAMIIEAICGVSECDLVKDWELTSFANYYDYKYISDSSNGTKTLRYMFQPLYDGYGGASGNNIQTQVIKWLKETVYKTRAAGTLSAAEVISTFQSKLVEADEPSPMLIRDWGDKYQNFMYSVVTDEQTDKVSSVDKYLTTDGVEATSDMCCTTDFISCDGYTKLLTNIQCRVTAVCYNAQKNKIGIVGDSNISEGTVLYDNKEHILPNGTKYIKLNLPKYSGLTAVLSTRSY